MSKLPNQNKKGVIMPFLMFLVLAVAGSVILFSSIKEQSSAPVLTSASESANFEGFADTKGGSGGKIIEVTNLNDSGAGSLREAINTDGARTVIFKVAGTITLKSGLKITKPYITIAGQTAPGGGILLRNDPANAERAIAISTNNVILRYIKVRPGPSTNLACCLDGIAVIGGKNVVVDHVSVSWATDGGFDIQSSENVTLQWSIVAETLKNSTNTKGSHSMGLLVQNSKGVSLHHNLFAHNNERNPRVDSAGGIVDVVNNIIYNPGTIAAVVTSETADVKLNYINNYLKEGVETLTKDPPIFPIAVTGKYYIQPLKMYVAGNYSPGRDADINNIGDLGFVRPADRKKPEFFVSTRFDAPQVTTYSAKELPERVLPLVGAVLPSRDSVDERLINEVKNGTGFIPDNPTQVGGWPVILGGSLVDNNGNGVPDSWEEYVKPLVTPVPPTLPTSSPLSSGVPTSTGNISTVTTGATCSNRNGCACNSGGVRNLSFGQVCPGLCRRSTTFAYSLTHAADITKESCILPTSPFSLRSACKSGYTSNTANETCSPVSPLASATPTPTPVSIETPVPQITALPVVTFQPADSGGLSEEDAALLDRIVEEELVDEQPAIVRAVADIVRRIFSFFSGR